MSVPSGAQRVRYTFNSSSGFSFSFEVAPPPAEGGLGFGNVAAAIDAGVRVMVAELESSREWTALGAGEYRREYVGDLSDGEQWP
jgi:hypothetical protein